MEYEIFDLTSHKHKSFCLATDFEDCSDVKVLTKDLRKEGFLSGSTGFNCVDAILLQHQCSKSKSQSHVALLSGFCLSMISSIITLQ
jgi:hypothetical protein